MINKIILSINFIINSKKVFKFYISRIIYDKTINKDSIGFV